MGAVADKAPAVQLETSTTILVVEDEVLVRMMVADQLREAGYHVLEASNADEALDLLRHGAVDVPVVVSDIDMPGSLDGVGLARAIRTESPLTKIVLVSGCQLSVDGVHHDGFFPKPYSAPAIIRHLKALLA
jgi:two-component system, response regulator PdtaR